MSQIRKNARKFAAMIGLCGIAFVAVPLSGTSVSAETAPVFTLDVSSGTAIQCEENVPYVVRSTGGAISSFSVTPAVPAGMSFNLSTGLMSGKPRALMAATAYTITAKNGAGSASQTFSMNVAQGTANGIYPTCQTVSGTVGVPFTPTATYTDIGVTSYYNFSISPALPAGLTIDVRTGVITGTPTEATPAENWVYSVRMDQAKSTLTWFVSISMTVTPAAATTTTVAATTTTVAATTTTVAATTTTTTVKPTTTTVAPTTTTVAPTTTITVAVAKKTTIVCTKGSTTKRVTAVNPKCPAGYKKKTK
jgi:hypothetical protein